MAYARPVLCRLCGFPAPDGGVRVSQVDRGKLSEWCLRLMDMELDQEGLEKAVFCQFCLWQARYLDDNCVPLEKSSRLPIWWKRCVNLSNEDFGYKYFLDEVIQPCAVTIPVMSKDVLQKHVLLADCMPRRRGPPCVFSNCIYCSAQLKGKKAMLRHVQEEHKNDLTFKCSTHKLYFLSSVEKDKHVEEFHRCLRVKCTHCTREFSALESLIRHLKQAHKREIFRCKYKCRAFFESAKLRNEHVQEVLETGDKRAKCIYCTKVFKKSKNILLAHMKRRHKTEAIKCDYQSKCPNFFLTQEEKQKHILEVHESGEDKIRCQFCPRMVKIKALNGHIRIHHNNSTGERVECIYCKSQMKKMNLAVHMARLHKTDGATSTRAAAPIS